MSVHRHSRTLHIYHDSWRSRRAQVTDSDKSTTLYEYFTQSGRPQIKVRKPASIDSNDVETVGTLKFYHWSSKIEADIHRGSDHHVFELKKRPLSVCDIRFASPRGFASQTLRWKSKSFSPGLILENEARERVARFSRNDWSMKKTGTIELIAGDMSGEAMDEVVLTCVAALWNTTYYHP